MPAHALRGGRGIVKAGTHDAYAPADHRQNSPARQRVRATRPDADHCLPLLAHTTPHTGTQTSRFLPCTLSGAMARHATPVRLSPAARRATWGQSRHACRPHCGAAPRWTGGPCTLHDGEAEDRPRNRSVDIQWALPGGMGHPPRRAQAPLAPEGCRGRRASDRRHHRRWAVQPAGAPRVGHPLPCARTVWTRQGVRTGTAGSAGPPAGRRYPPRQPERCASAAPGSRSADDRIGWPNARGQPLGTAGARHERTLFPVGCTPLFG